MKHIFLRIAVAAVALIVPSFALAATVNLSGGGITVPMGKSYTLEGTLTSITLNGSTLSVTLGAGESITLTSPDTTKFVQSSSGLTTSTTCSDTAYSFSWTNPSGGSANTFTVEPSATTCTTASSGGAGGSGGSGSSGGGGGGGGNASPLSTPPTPPPPTPSPTPPPASIAPSPFSITSDLARGMTGIEVSQLQAYLATDPLIYPEGKITGYFGPATEAAVKRFQAKYGISQVGRVGPLTRSKLQEVFAAGLLPVPPPPTPAPSGPPASGLISQELARGSTGDDVTRLQTYLAADPALYPEAKITGYFGPATEAAVKRFQAKYGISQVGRVGPATMAKLNELLGGASMPPPAGPPPPSAPVDNSAAIKAIEDQLKILNDQMKVLLGQ